MLMKGAPRLAVGLAQELPGSQTRQRASPGSCKDSNPWHELGNGAGAEKGCAAAQGSFSPRFSHWHLSRDAPSAAGDRHTPRADVAGCSAWQISPRTRKTNPFFPLAKWLLILFVLKQEGILVLPLNKIPGIWQRHACSGGSSKEGLGVGLLCSAQIELQRMPLQKLCTVQPTLLHITVCFPGMLCLLWLLGGPSAKVWNQDYF